MYNFIFFVMYNYQISKNESFEYGRFNGSLITGVGIYLQILVIFGFIKKFFYSDFIFSIQYKLLAIFFMIIIIILTYLYYNTRRINNNATRQIYSPTTWRKFLVFLFIAIPLSLILILAIK